MKVPSLRIRDANDHPLRGDGDYVLYWMTAFRRTRHNFALQHAVDRARELKKPLVIFEPLRVGYRWASDRLHRFVIDGMQANARALQRRPVTYFPYLEPAQGAGKGLLVELARSACTVVGDDFPCFFLPRMMRAVRHRIPARLELVDSNGVLPLALAERTFTVAHSYRRYMQKQVLDFLLEAPAEDPLARVRLPALESLPETVRRRWPAADLDHWRRDDALAALPIDHAVTPAPIGGGMNHASSTLERFLTERLHRYASDRNHPDADGESGLSPYLHFGHISAHQILEAVMDREQWTPDRASSPHGKNRGFWNTSESAEAFLDQLLTWRELGFNGTSRHPDSYDRYESLPEWARKTLAEHADDPRPHLYSREQFERAETHDELWNAAQRQIVQTGMMHNYMRMLWGKKILHWSPSPQDALATMIELNNKYGLDGRDPNSYSGIFWVLGRYDRAWGPKRPIFGSVRYMTSDSTRKKLKLKTYLQRFGPPSCP